jgi:preprotein translocase subunit YajC
MGLILLLVLFAAMYWFTLRPQQQRLKAQRALIQALEVGDEVMTAGGLLGRVTAIEDTEIRLEVAPGVDVRMARAAVTQRVAQDDTTD